MKMNFRKQKKEPFYEVSLGSFVGEEKKKIQKELHWSFIFHKKCFLIVFS